MCAIGSTPRGDTRLSNWVLYGSSATKMTVAAIPMVKCVGCGQDFSVKGYTYHIHTTSHQPCISVYEEEVRRALESLQDALDGTHQQLNVRHDNPLPFNNEALNWDDVDDREVEESDAELDDNDVNITGELQELPNQPNEGPQAER